MHIPGHVAVALLQRRLPPLSHKKGMLTPLLVACLFPDLIDKTIGYVFKVMPNGRHYAHNLFSLFGVTLLVTLIWGKARGLAWFAGYLGHLMVDFNGTVPWLFPARKYNFPKSKFRFRARRFIREFALLFPALVFYRLSR